MASNQASQGSGSHRGLILILAVYLLLACGYAVRTPAWQAPDEPAHYNYVRYLYEERRLPELRPGDYPVDYLEEIKARRFPAEMSIEPIRYESHQPPLYYLLATPVFALGRALGSDTPLLPLRLLSVALGALLIGEGYAVVGLAFPRRREWTWGTAAFMATLPMHVAMTAVVNNDVLAALILTQIVWMLLRAHQSGWTNRRAAVLGLLVGAALLTKLQAYIAVPLVAMGWAWEALRLRGERRALASLTRQGLLVAVIALALVLPWLARNMAVYGISDPLGMARHDQVVVGQLTTRELLEEIGLRALVLRFCQTTFQSFWGQFGWMGVLMPVRVYQALVLLSGLALLGVLDGLRGLGGLWRDEIGRYSSLLLGAWLAFTAAGFVWYNLQYVQHQGRYLFPALVPLGLLFTAGLQRLLRRCPLWALLTLAASLVALVLWGLAVGHVPRFAVALVAGALLGVLLGHAIERRWPGLTLMGLYLGLAGLTAWAAWRLLPWLLP